MTGMSHDAKVHEACQHMSKDLHAASVQVLATAPLFEDKLCECFPKRIYVRVPQKKTLHMQRKEPVQNKL